MSMGCNIALWQDLHAPLPKSLSSSNPVASGSKQSLWTLAHRVELLLVCESSMLLVQHNGNPTESLARRHGHLVLLIVLLRRARTPSLLFICY
eukprot:88118-Amphidinium_carterae.2